MKIKTEDAIQHFKGVANLAAKLGISRAAIYQWGEWVPDSRVYQIHVLSDHALPTIEGAASDSLEMVG